VAYRVIIHSVSISVDIPYPDGTTWFAGLLYSLHVGNKVIIHSVSVVLGLGILVDIPYLARLVSSSMGRDNPC
jgi:hypothetical protein